MASGASVPPEAITAGISAMRATLANPKASHRDKAIAVRTLADLLRLEQGSVELEMKVEEHDLLVQKMEAIEQKVNKAEQ